MNCIHCDEPNPHPGTRKCSDLNACERRQEYERGIAEGERRERAAVVAVLKKRARYLPNLSRQAVTAMMMDIEAGEHIEETT